MADLLTSDQARQAILDAAPPVRSETVSLAEAAGRVLAEPLIARRTQPPLALSAMDGYAVRFADCAVGAALCVTGEAPAGARGAGTIGPGETLRIFTGGPVPGGADHILIQEEAERDGDTVTIAKAQYAPAFIRPAGLDFSDGDTLLPAGAGLTPARLALAAAANHAELTVARRPVVAILCSGDELVEPGEPLRGGRIVNSAGYGLAALIQAWGGEARRLPAAKDEIASIHARIEMARGADIFVPIGGASVGDRDVMRAAFQDKGFALIFEKLAVRPGKPTWFGQAEKQRVLGLPGNPASALVCAHLFLKPLIFAATGRDGDTAVKTVPARLTADIAENGWRESWLRGRSRMGDDGMVAVEADAREDSSQLTPFAQADCLIRRPPDAPAAQAGELAEILYLEGGAFC